MTEKYGRTHDEKLLNPDGKEQVIPSVRGFSEADIANLYNRRPLGQLSIVTEDKPRQEMKTTITRNGEFVFEAALPYVEMGEVRGADGIEFSGVHVKFVRIVDGGKVIIRLEYERNLQRDEQSDEGDDRLIDMEPGTYVPARMAISKVFPRTAELDVNDPETEFAEIDLKELQSRMDPSDLFITDPLTQARQRQPFLVELPNLIKRSEDKQDAILVPALTLT